MAGVLPGPVPVPMVSGTDGIPSVVGSGAFSNPLDVGASGTLVEGVHVAKLFPIIALLAMMMVQVNLFINRSANNSVNVYINQLMLMLFPFMRKYLKSEQLKKKEKYPEYYDYPEYPPYEEGPYRRSSRSVATPDFSQFSNPQIDHMARVVKSALESEKCWERLICETGVFLKTFPVIKSVVEATSKLTPTVFHQGADCDRFSCGRLPIKK